MSHLSPLSMRYLSHLSPALLKVLLYCLIRAMAPNLLQGTMASKNIHDCEVEVVPGFLEQVRICTARELPASCKEEETKEGWGDASFLLN